MTLREEFAWQRYPHAEEYLKERFDELVAAMPTARAFSSALLTQTGSLLFDWLDHLILADGDLPQRQLEELGFEPEDVPADRDWPVSCA